MQISVFHCDPSDANISVEPYSTLGRVYIAKIESVHEILMLKSV